MKYVISRYNHDMDWIKDYSDEYVVYDRSENPLFNSVKVNNVGSDIYDKFTFIIDNYDNLPDVAIYTKANIFKYITKEEFDLIKDNKTFTPILTQHHKEVMCDQGMLDSLGIQGPKPYSYYKAGMYYELNYPAYLKEHKTKDPYYSYSNTYLEHPLYELLGIKDMEYVPFAPGSNYILPKENILKHSKEFYEKLRSYLEWAVYPGEAMLIERSLYTIWS